MLSYKLTIKIWSMYRSPARPLAPKSAYFGCNVSLALEMPLEHMEATYHFYFFTNLPIPGRH